MPVGDFRIISEISGHFGLAVHAGLVDEIKPHIVRNHRADGIEIPRVEMRHIGAEPIAIGVRQFWMRQIVRLVSQFAELRAAAMQRRFHGRQAEIQDVANLF